MLKINSLSVSVDDNNVLNDFNLDIKLGEVHAIMGPNGIGKSTICNTIIGSPNYKITYGEIIYNGEKINDMSVTERARKGIFLLSQNPIAIPGVSNAEMLRLALSEKENKNIPIFEFNQKMEHICKMLDIPKSFIHRSINDGMSGGERKKNELLHLWMLDPKLIILDELDSGLDVDSLKIVCESLRKYYEEHKCSILIISHHPEVLKLLNATNVHILSSGKIVKSGDITLADKIEKDGYKNYSRANDVSENEE